MPLLGPDQVGQIIEAVFLQQLHQAAFHMRDFVELVSTEPLGDVGVWNVLAAGHP